MKKRLYNWGVVSAIILLIAGLTITTMWFYTYEVGSIKTDKKILLKKITDLKVSILKTWQNERLSEVRFISNNDQFGEIVQAYFSHKTVPNAVVIDEWLAQLLRNHNYSGYYLLDSDKQIIYSNVYPDYLKSINFAPDIIHDSVNVFYEQAGTDNGLYGCIAAPVRIKEVTVGYTVLIINLTENILPEIGSWPEFDDSGQIFFYDKKHSKTLVTDDGFSSSSTPVFTPDEIVFTDTVLESEDNDGIGILSYTTKIPDTEWALIARLKMEKVYKRINSFSTFFLIANIILILIASFFLYYYVKKKDLFVKARIEAEEAKSEFLARKFNLFQDNANDVIFLLDLDANILESNKKAVETYGYSREEFLTKNIRDLKPAEERGNTQYYLEQVKKKEKYRFETTHVTRDNKRIEVEISSSTIEHNNKKFIQSIIRDITQRKNSENRILTLNRYYSLLSKTNQILVKNREQGSLLKELAVAGTTEGKFTIVLISELKNNNYYINVLAERKISQPVYDKSIPLQISEEQQHILKNNSHVIVRNIEAPDTFLNSISNESAIKIQSYALFPIGNRGETGITGFIAFLHKRPDLFKGEELRLLIEMTNDVNFAIRALEDRRKKESFERRLVESERRLTTIMGNLPGMVYQCRNDEEWTMLFVSQGCEPLTGYKFEEIMHNRVVSYAHLIFPSDRERVSEEVNLALARKSRFDIEYRIVTKDKTIKWVYERGIGIENENGDKFIEGFISDMTEIKKAREAIKTSRDFYLYLFNILPNPIFKTDAEGKVDYVNQAWISFTGSTGDDTRGFGWLKSIYFEDYIKFREVYLEAIRERTYYNYELRLKTGNGDYKWVIVTGLPYQDPNGDYAGYLGSVFDINESKTASEALDKSVRVYRELFDNNPQPMWVYDISSLRILSVNEAALETYMYSKAEFLRLSLLDLRPEEEIPRFLHELKKKDEKGRWSSGWIHKRKDGSLFEVESNSHALPDLDGRKVRLVVVNDVTERNLAYKLLKQSEDKFKTIYENASIGLFTAHYDGTIVMANPTFLKMMGYDSIDELRNDKISNLTYYNYSEASSLRNQFLEKGSFRGFETEWLNKRGEKLYIRLNVDIIEKDGDVLFEGTVEDISAKKEIEKTLITAKEEAERSEELKGNFLAQISHEIRTPINVIINFINLIKEKFSDEEKDEELVFSFEAIDSASHRIIRTVDLILNMSQLQSGSYEPTNEEFDLQHDVIYPLYREFKSFADEKELEFNIIANESSYPVLGDMYGTRQIFSNLVDNAIKYTKRGKIEISVFVKENNYICEVSDTGIGMNDLFLETIFEPFVQEEQGYSREFEGNGLGLALVKNYCDLNEFDISVKSKKGEGTTFKIVIPKNKN